MQQNSITHDGSQQVLYSKNGNPLPESVAKLIFANRERRQADMQRREATKLWQIRYSQRSYAMFDQFVKDKVAVDGPLGFEMNYSTRWAAVQTVGNVDVDRLLAYVNEFEAQYPNTYQRDRLEELAFSSTANLKGAKFGKRVLNFR